MKKLFFCLASLFALPAQAQQATVVPSCGSVTLGGTQSGLFVDTKGRLCSDNPAYPSGSTPVTSSATGTTGAITATLAAAAGKTTYICGFFFAGTNATAANTATNLTITGTISGTLNFGFPTLAAGATIPNSAPIDEEFYPCVPGSAVNTAVVVNGPALGAGATLVTVTAWGFQL